MLHVSTQILQFKHVRDNSYLMVLVCVPVVFIKYQLFEMKFYGVLCLPRFAEGKSEEIAKEALENGRVGQGTILEALRCHEATAG